MPKKTKRVVYGGPAEELDIDMRGSRLVLPKGVAKKVTDAEFEYLKNCRKKLNVVPVESWDEDRLKSLKERMIKE